MWRGKIRAIALITTAFAFVVKTTPVQAQEQNFIQNFNIDKLEIVIKGLEDFKTATNPPLLERSDSGIKSRKS